MKLITFAGAGAFIFLSAFVMKKETGRQLSTVYDTKWELRKIYIGDSAETVTGNAFIKFNQAKKTAGGNCGCNSFGSSVSVSGNTISIKDIISTQMYCEVVQQTENTFFAQLGKVNRFVITGKALKMYKDKWLLLEFESK